MVALDDEGNPHPVPPIEPRTERERHRQREADLRRATRLREREEIVAGRAATDG
jgi:acyl-CoA hydrolase